MDLLSVSSICYLWYTELSLQVELGRIFLFVSKLNPWLGEGFSIRCVWYSLISRDELWVGSLLLPLSFSLPGRIKVQLRRSQFSSSSLGNGMCHLPLCGLLWLHFLCVCTVYKPGWFSFLGATIYGHTGCEAVLFYKSLLQTFLWDKSCRQSGKTESARGCRGAPPLLTVRALHS